MRIAQLAPLHETVPPHTYGGTERVVSYLTEELVARGHDVTLYAAGDSQTSARLVACSASGLRLDPGSGGAKRDPIARHLAMLERVGRETDRYDVIHSHLEVIGLPFSHRWPTPTVSTLHGRLDVADLLPLFWEYQSAPVVSISNSQRSPLPWLNWVGTVYHGLPAHTLAMCSGPGRYLAFLGRVSPDKGVDSAIEIARRTGLPLKIAAKIDGVDREYYESRIRRHVDGRDIELVGEIGEHEKGDFLGGAVALLFPIRWPEPFGLVMIEALACGTPVLAFRRGSVPEVLSDPDAGVVVATVDAAVEALERVQGLNRRGCRSAFERKFSSARMAEDYEAVYRRVAQLEPVRQPPSLRSHQSAHGQ